MPLVDDPLMVRALGWCAGPSDAEVLLETTGTIRGTWRNAAVAQSCNNQVPPQPSPELKLSATRIPTPTYRPTNTPTLAGARAHTRTHTLRVSNSLRPNDPLKSVLQLGPNADHHLATITWVLVVPALFQSNFSARRCPPHSISQRH